MKDDKKKDVQEIKFDHRNYRKHSNENKAIIAKSLDECGAGRSILIDSEGEIIAGNGVYEQAKKKGIPVRVVETDGSELVVVKRTDLQTEDERRKKLALADNASSDNVQWDMPVIQTDFDVEELQSWGIKIRATEAISKMEIDTSMYYIPKEQPHLRLEDCIDLTKFNAKLKALDEYDLTEEQKERLKFFAYRFIKINFEGVANYYFFNATDEERKAIERLRLVLVDGGLNGFIEDDMLRLHEIAVMQEEDEDD